METDLKKQLAALKEKLRSWRPTIQELGHDYRDMAAPLRTTLTRFPGTFTVLGFMGLFFIGVLVGFGAKTMAEDGLVIGHSDYRLLPAERLYTLNELREEALAAGASLPVEPKKVYPACGEAEDLSL